MSPFHLSIALYAAAFLCGDSRGAPVPLLGSSTNVIIADMLREADVRPGDVYAGAHWLAGVDRCLCGHVDYSPWLLPKRQSVLRQREGMRQFTVELVIDDNSTVAGQSMEQAGLRHMQAAYLIAIMRAGEDLGWSPACSTWRSPRVFR